MIAPLFDIEPLPSTKDHLEAFNDLALEWVEPTKLEQAVKEGKLPQRLVHDMMPRQESEADRDNEVKNDEAEKSTRTEEMTEALDSLNLSATTTTTTERETSRQDRRQSLGTLHIGKNEIGRMQREKERKKKNQKETINR